MNNKELPLISILLATYNPNMDWLRQQLISLNNQTYKNLELYVCDDCSNKISYESIKNLVEECITTFPFNFEKNNVNLGSTLTYQNLTLKAKGKYIAYCDQDDVWFPYKIEREYKVISEKNAQLVYSDLIFTDTHLNIITDSRINYYKQDLISGGKEISSFFLKENCVPGCTILIDANLAKQATPFCPYMCHDKYLALFSTINGRIYALKKPTLYYRRHWNAQTEKNILLTRKEEYKKVHIDWQVLCYEWLKKHLKCDKALYEEINLLLMRAKARTELFQNGLYSKELLKNLKIAKIHILFEKYSRFIPDTLFENIIKMVNLNNQLKKIIKNTRLKAFYHFHRMFNRGGIE